MSSSTSTAARALRAALVGTLTLAPFAAAGAVLLPATAAPPAPPAAAELAAGYLQDRLAAGDHHLSQVFDDGDGTITPDEVFPDHGVTADAVLAMGAAGTGQTEAAAATAWLQQERLGYTGFGDEAEVYAGPVAKLLNVAVAQGVDPTAFGGMDLVATLEGLEGPDGRFSDQSQYGDNSNVFGQSLAVGGLARAGEGPSAAATDFLRAQQCDDGGFPVFVADGCESDPDATALAVQALIRVAGAEDGDAGDGLDYLAAQQDDSTGAVGGSGPTAAVNANSTGLAGQAFLAGARSAQARLAQSYVRGLQYGCEFPADLRGGIAYDQATYDLKLAAAQDADDDTSAAPTDQDNRSTAQAALALADIPLFAVTSTGADAVAARTDCDDPSATTTATSSAPPSATGSVTSTGPASTGPAGTDTPSASTSEGGVRGESTTAPGVGAGGAIGVGDQAAPVRSEGLASTGSEPLPLVVAALVLAAVGGGLVLVRRVPRGRHQ